MAWVPRTVIVLGFATSGVLYLLDVHPWLICLPTLGVLAGARAFGERVPVRERPPRNPPPAPPMAEDPRQIAEEIMHEIKRLLAPPLTEKDAEGFRTLREALDVVNDGLACVIAFHTVITDMQAILDTALQQRQEPDAPEGGEHATSD